MHIPVSEGYQLDVELQEDKLTLELLLCGLVVLQITMSKALLTERIEGDHVHRPSLAFKQFGASKHVNKASNRITQSCYFGRRKPSLDVIVRRQS